MSDISNRDERDLELLQNLAPDGKPTPEMVVEAARSKQHPWHGEIWGQSDKEAAMCHRLDVAREIICRVRFRIVRDERIMFRPAFVRNPELKASQSGYIAIDALQNQPAMAVSVMDAELARIMGCIGRARGLADQFGLGTEFERLLATAIDLKTRLRLVA